MQEKASEILQIDYPAHYIRYATALNLERLEGLDNSLGSALRTLGIHPCHNPSIDNVKVVPDSCRTDVCIICQQIHKS